MSVDDSGADNRSMVTCEGAESKDVATEPRVGELAGSDELTGRRAHTQQTTGLTR